MLVKDLQPFLNKTLKVVLVMLKSNCGFNKTTSTDKSYLYKLSVANELSGSCTSLF